MRSAVGLSEERTHATAIGDRWRSVTLLRTHGVQPRMRAVLVIAGGRSTRFGDRDKAVAELDGTPMIRRVVDRVADVVDEVVINCRADQVDPISAALDDGPVAVSNIAQNVQQSAWRQAALAVGHQSALAVPVSLDDYQYGVLAVYADEPDVFGEFETAVFAELGTSIANAITSITTRRALNADTLTALELRVEDTTDQLLDIALGSGCTVTYEGVGTVSADETQLFVRVSGCDPATVSELLADRHTIADHHLVSESEDGGVFEVTIQGETVIARLVRQGGRVRKIAAEESGIDVEVDVPTSVDVRSFVETLTDDGTVELVSRRERARSAESDPALAETILGALTDRQREVLRTGYFSGFFNWPRDTTGQELAAMLDVSQPTVNRHLRLGQQRIMRQLFDDESGAE